MLWNQKKSPICRGRLGAAVTLWMLSLAVLLSVCLSACSDEVLHTGNESLSLVTGNDRNPDGTGNLGLVTEPATGGSIIITPSDDPFAEAAHVMRVDFLETGDADAILLRVDDDVVLVDTGETDDYGTITSALAEYGIFAIDHLIITHYDNDHIGTAAQILKNYEVGAVYMPDYIRDSRLYRSLSDVLDILADSGKTVTHRLTEDMTVSLGYGRLDISPTHLYEPGQTLGSDDSHALQENNYSLMTTVTFGEVRLLLAGDAEGERIREYMATLPDGGVDIDVIKIPHHGAYDKELGNLLRAAKGYVRYCVVSVGTTTPVDAALVTAMRSAGAGIYYTYNGHVRFSTDGTSMVMEQG